MAADAPVGMVACPGDPVLRLPEVGEVRVGSGLRQSVGHLVATKAGVVDSAAKGKVWVRGRQKRYAPAVGDAVLGLVLERHSENYAVHIGGPFPAQLPALAFEGATRRNKPNLQVGDLVYARVSAAPRDMDPELSCVDVTGKSSGYGPLTGGMTFTVSSAQARDIMSNPPPKALAALGTALQFELAVGLNGVVWVDSPSPAISVLVANAIPAIEGIGEAAALGHVKRLLDTAAGGGGARDAMQQ